MPYSSKALRIEKTMSQRLILGNGEEKQTLRYRSIQPDGETLVVELSSQMVLMGMFMPILYINGTVFVGSPRRTAAEPLRHVGSTPALRCHD